MSETRTYLITGGAGFIGSHLADALLDAGHHVSVIDNLSTGSLTNVRHLFDHPRFEFARAEIEDDIVLDRLAASADAIIHAAAAVGVKLIVQRPVQTIETNVAGTEHVLRAAARYGCSVLITSTSEVYGKNARVPFTEEDDLVLGPTSKNRWAYAASKIVDEFLGLAYWREYDLPVVIARLFNTVGPRQTGEYGMVVPRFVQQAIIGDPLTVYGDGTQTRCFCDVADTVRALTALVDHPDALGKVFNVGGTDLITIRELAERVLSVTGSEAPIENVPYEEAYGPGFEDMARRQPSTERIRQLVSWAPNLTIDDTLRRVRDYIQGQMNANQ